jgi:energy-coupling factor transporter ATP-binding protein EcfA2
MQLSLAPAAENLDNEKSHPHFQRGCANFNTLPAGNGAKIGASPRMVMDHVSVDLQNCYGIKRLKTDFDFSKETIYAIYAPNGCMKSSLAHTFRDISDRSKTTDRVFPARTTVRKIVDETGTELPASSVFVVLPYDAEFGPNERTSTLLVNAALKKEHDQLLALVEEAKAALLKALKDQSRSKRNIETEISSIVTGTEDDFIRALIRLQKEVEDQADAPFADADYDTLFHENVMEFLNKPDAKSAIDAYVNRYNELLAASMYFKKGIFDYYGAAQIADALTKHGFFDAKHTVTLKSNGKTKEINTKKEPEGVIEEEKKTILTDPALRKQFDQISDMLKKNIPLRTFQDYIMSHEALLANLQNVRKFKEDIWKSCLKEKLDLYQDLMTKYGAVSTKLKDIEAQAARENTQWQEVIDIFNARFVVPFTLEVENKLAVMLEEQAIKLAFVYHDGADNAPVERSKLLDILSTGEKKALYILNIIFEVEVRRQNKSETLMVIDDLADSFDYQNKYAIIQYLREINEDRLFKQIIMTHNFDFLRVLNSRFVRYNCLMTSKDASGVTLQPAVGIRNPFVVTWKGQFYKKNNIKIASIPFIRNLIEMTVSTSDANYLKLTSLLHWKIDTPSITVADLDNIYNHVFAAKEPLKNSLIFMVCE